MPTEAIARYYADVDEDSSENGDQHEGAQDWRVDLRSLSLGRTPNHRFERLYGRGASRQFFFGRNHAAIVRGIASPLSEESTAKYDAARERGRGLVCDSNGCVDFEPSEQLRKHFKDMFNGNFLAHGLLRLAGRALTDEAAGALLRQASVGALSRIADYVRGSSLASHKEFVLTKSYKKLLIAGIASRFPRLSESESVSIAQATLLQLDEALDLGPMRIEEGTLLKRKGELVLQLD